MGRDFPGYSEDELKSIKAPALIMPGERDGVKPEHAVEMMRLIPTSHLAIFPGAGYFVLFTRPDALTDAIIAFFEWSTPALWLTTSQPRLSSSSNSDSCCGARGAGRRAGIRHIAVENIESVVAGLRRYGPERVGAISAARTASLTELSKHIGYGPRL
jgi:hypothetical protein